ncbi:PREDICTED: elongin-A-like [Tarenaya hassleriana]|uniref:elongin-A-like n=1 Tax=Tarenaya hassleriana TaxID=28532 RepID=UPI00053C7E64|nr:PREDICTED: elongin-A-like [Tarenaya hassleriana]
MSVEEQCRKPPSLVELCIMTAIDNVRFIGYVGGLDFQLLDQILQHCTVEQLMHVEDCTADTDLSPITNKLWKRFYEKQFGYQKMNVVIERMKRNRVTFKWRHLYEAKLKDVEQDEERAADRLKQLYEKEVAKKQNRKTKLCAKVPPGNKRGFWGGPGHNLSGVKSNIMKKAKLDLLKSQEMKNLAAMKRKAVQKSFSISAPKRSILPANVPSTSKATSFRSPPPKKSSISANVPSSSRNTATRQNRT